MEYQITSEKHYHELMILIYDLMDKGEENLTDSEIEKLRTLTIATEKFEDEVLGLKPVKQPDSIPKVLELFMFENKISQVLLCDKNIIKK